MNDITTQAFGCETSGAALERVQRFLYHEARLLDQSRFAEWLDLFSEDAIYWIPATRGQTDPLNVPSIIYDNKDLLSMRVRRLSDPRTYQTMAPPHTTRIIGNIMIGEEERQGGTIEVYSTAFVHECREEVRRLFSAQCTHVLCDSRDGLKIVSKRVDLVDCDTVHSAFMSLM